MTTFDKKCLRPYPRDEIPNQNQLNPVVCPGVFWGSTPGQAADRCIRDHSFCRGRGAVVSGGVSEIFRAKRRGGISKIEGGRGVMQVYVLV